VSPPKSQRMPQATFYFPRGFLWGAATSSHQVEGSNTNNNWSAWETQPGRILKNQRAGLACDWWGGRWKADFDRAAEASQNAHRLSIEWSRIQPTPDHWAEEALDYYRQMVRGLVERGLTPMVTLHHFTNPLWLEERGGWENDQTPQLFNTFVNKVVEALQEYVSLWVTINEPNIYAYCAYIDGNFPPGKKSLAAGFRVMLNLLRAHASAYQDIHLLQPQARVGVAHHYRGIWPARPGFPPDVWMARTLSSNFNESFNNALLTGKLRFAFRGASLPQARRTQDFFGLNYYTVEQVRFRPFAFRRFLSERFFPPDAAQSSTGFIANVPQGLYKALQWANGFKLPILITENGVDDQADLLRPRYLAEHLHQVWRAINFNWPIKGYFHWSLVDNFEWERGWTQRFGLWGLDPATQARFRRPSVDLYAAICKLNGISSEAIARYAPQAFPRLFPS